MGPRLSLIASAALLLAAAPPPDLEKPDDGKIRFPALETTIVEPEADQGALERCSTLGGQRLCDEDLGEAWCRKQGFGGGFVSWRTYPPVEKAECADIRFCTRVAAITCRGTPFAD
jgi:hypothetical protein